MARKTRMELKKLEGQNLRRLRERRGLSPQQLADLVDTNVKYVYMMQGGKAGIGPDMMQRLCAVFEVDEAEFQVGIDVNHLSPLFGDFVTKIKEIEKWPRSKQLRIAADLEELLDRYWAENGRL